VREEGHEGEDEVTDGTSETRNDQDSTLEILSQDVSASQLNSDSEADEGGPEASNTEDAEHDQDGEDGEDSDEDDASSLISTATSGAMPAQRPLAPNFFEQTCPHHPSSPPCAHPPTLVVYSARSSCRS
jgi:hypothetical protein